MKTVVIGSGISGLTAALYLLRDGHRVVLLEQYSEIGGVTAAVRKDGYTWEMGQLILEGLDPGEQIGYILEELGIYDKIPMVRNDRIYSFPDFVMRKPESYGGPWWRKDFLSSLFPEDRGGLDRYYRLYVRFMEIVTIARNSERTSGLRSLFLKARLYLKLLPLLPKIKWSAQRLMRHYFKSEKLQAVFMSILADFVVRPSQFPGLGIPAVNPEPAFESRIPLKVSSAGRQPSYQNIIGGVSTLVGVLADEITRAGGEIKTSTAVRKIRIADNGVKAVICDDGSQIETDCVMVSGGAKEAFFDLIGREHLPAAFISHLEDLALMESIFMVHLGVDFDPTPIQKGNLCYYYLTYDFEKGVEDIQNGHYHEGNDGFLLYIPSFHSPSMAPAGGHAVTIYTIAPNAIVSGGWEDRKEEFADKLIDLAEQYVPGLRTHTRVKIIMTPEDFRKRTYLKHHSFGGCAPVMGKKGIPHKTPIDGLWFIGAQSESGAGINNVMEGVWRCVRMLRKSLKN